ncbi:MAG: VPLPA-CTERM sorting domain-containing protein [Pseudomonadota bacterium]
MNKLLATAATALALTVAAGSAQAITILYTEGSDIPANSGFSTSFLTLDVNQDGRADLSFREVVGSTYSYTGAYGRNGARVSYGSAYSAGDSIGPGFRGSRAAALTGSYDFTSGSRQYSGTFGAWDDGTTGVRTGYLGFQLGTGEYGWAHLSLNPLGSAEGPFGQLLSFGYETDLGVSVIAGDGTEVIPNPLPASAWFMGAGILGMGAFARRRKKAA